MSKLRIMADFHHSGAARGQVLVLQARLGHEVYFPDTKFAEWAKEITGSPSILLPCLPSWTKSMGGFPKEILKPDGTWPNLVSYEEFMDTDWDAVLVTRIETPPLFQQLINSHPKGAAIKVIGMTGNEGTKYDWGFVKNFMSSDYSSFINAPAHVNKVWYSQEMGLQFQRQPFVEIDETSLRKINCFVNCWDTFIATWHWDCERSYFEGRCPHCDCNTTDTPQPDVQPYHIWTGAKDALPDYNFTWYGISSPVGCIPEVCLPVEYTSGSLTMHFKTYDGYGFSMLQSIACGRPVIIPRRFHKYRTAGKYLIPGLTCFEAEWNSDSVVEVIKYVTENVQRANAYAWACHHAAKALFNWELEAMKIKEFLEKLE